MRSLILYTVPALIVWISVYALPNPTPEELIERENRQAIMDCLDTLSGSSLEIQKGTIECSKIPFRSITWTGQLTPASEPPSKKWYTAKHELVLSGSHDYRIYSDRNWAVWKNNNPSGLTWWVSNTLKGLWKEKWVNFSKWTLRPKNEWWNYILFSSIEEWLRAKVIAIRERWWKATVGHFLAWWGTDHVTLSFSKSKIISELTEEEFAELFIQQIKKESPWLTSQLVKDWILIVK